MIWNTVVEIMRQIPTCLDGGSSQLVLYDMNTVVEIMMIVRWFSISLKYPVVWRLQRMTFSFQWKWLVIVWSLSLCLKHWISLGKQTSLNISKLNLRLLKVAITKCFPLIIIISSQCICKWIAMLMKVLDKLDDLLYTVSPKIGPFLFWTWLWQNTVQF